MPDRRRKQARYAALVIRAPGRQRLPRETRARHGQRVVVVPAEQTTRSDPSNGDDRPDPVTARLLLAHAQRARHLLADRRVLAHLRPPHRDELMAEIRRMRDVVRTLEDEIEATTRSVAAMDDLADRLQRLTGLLQESGVMGHSDLETSEDHSNAAAEWHNRHPMER
ncbi:hypothetical protein PHYBOEH_011480 [Phytophthora boehmeriae]|uniref:Uncharacterized protein n=1 Tax=Phytophthora boehmeriae TaxID=109152 RepID=A0A8T1VJI6_9STRA|nr:hypothetical protein PHYBOEH_011480 [Phytophthora boehmeriae]